MAMDTGTKREKRTKCKHEKNVNKNRRKEWTDTKGKKSEQNQKERKQDTN